MVLPSLPIAWGRSRPVFWFMAMTLVMVILWGWQASRATPERMTATVDYAPNGDTLELLFELSAEVPVTTVRLKGVQAPSLDQSPWGQAARECLADLRNEVITVESDDWTADPYGRVWAYGWHGQTFLNQYLLEQGCGYLIGDRLTHAQHYSQLVYAQEVARLLGRGIWNPQQPLRNPA